MVRDNFTANLVSYAGDVMTHHSEDYKAQIELAAKAGVPIAQHDREELTKALQAQAEAEKAKENVIAQAQAVVEAKAETKPKRKPSQKRKPETKPETEAEKAETITETKEPELVAVS
jgi:beta-glucosidase-like glycosyl hydrolase